MNFEFTVLTPRHNNTRVRNKITNWSGSDQRDVWEQNLKDPQRRKHLEEHNWLNEDAITYSYNDHGFREQQFDTTPGYLALGCSFTEGVGLNLHQVWPKILEEKIQTKIWNLGIGGASSDTCFRILDYYLNNLNVIGVFFLQPPPDRFELHTPSWIKCYMPMMSYGLEDEIIFKSWITDERNSDINVKKNLLAMEKLCDNQGIKLISRQCSELFSGRICLARDMLHHGEYNQQQLAEKFYQDWKNGG